MSGADVGDAAAEAAMPLAGADDSAANLRGVKRARPTGLATPDRGRARTSGWMAREMRRHGGGAGCGKTPTSSGVFRGGGTGQCPPLA